MKSKTNLILYLLLVLGVLLYFNPITISPQKIHAAAPTNGLVGYWNFDEGSGTVANDTSGSGNNGTINGASWIAGKIGSGALSFDGTGNYVNLGSPSSLDFSQENAFTISAWVYPDGAIGSYAAIFSRGGVNVGNTNTVYHLSSNNAGTGWSATISDGTNLVINSALNTIVQRTWQHMTLVWNGTTLILYKDASVIDSDTNVSFTGLWDGNDASDRYVNVGRDAKNGGHLWPGNIDDVRVYSRALSASEITDIYNDTGGTPPPPPTPVNGSCGATVNTCTTGIFSDVADTSTNYLWNCLGSNGGTNASCSLPIPPAPPITYTLTVSKSGTGQGTVTGTGISCGSDCLETANSGTSITLTAASQPNSTFIGWSGGGCSGTGSCAIILNSDITVTTTFNFTQTSGTVNAASCSLTDIQSAINSVSTGGIVNVPSGNCTWSSQLSITKGIILQGAGVGSTVIIANTGSAYLIKYAPSNPSLNESFRLTGFEFNLQNASPGFHLVNNTTYAITNIRIDHNEWNNCVFGQPFLIQGALWGVVDSNTFNGQCHIDNYGVNATSWLNFPYAFGSINNLYYEDNVFNNTDTVFSGGAGGRYAFRYNTVNLSTVNLYPILDAHGDQGSGSNHATMGIEIYGNRINGNGRNSRLTDHRGGTGVIFYNAYNNGTMDLQVRDEFCDETGTPPTGPFNGVPQHVSNSYYWNNRDDGVLRYFNLSQAVTGCAYPPIAPNVNFWDYNASFNGTSGTGCGAPASRPAVCTTGVGYWATDQSCSSVDPAHVGASPTAPLSGTLYKCTSPNTWTAFYTPYTYPHPLRSSGALPPPDTTPPSVPAGPTATTISSSQINLSWTASTDNVGVAGYRVYRNGVQITTVTNTTYQDTGLSPSTTYSYIIVAYDGAGNTSVPSSSASATTQGVVTTGDYWVSSTGSAAWSSCRSTTPLIGSAACSLATANTNAAAGNIVYLLAGTYGVYIAPVNSGNLSARIIFRNYSNEVVTISNAAYGIHLNGNDYITIQGINFSNLDRFMYLENNADYNIITNSVFNQMRTMASWAGSRIWQNSDHNIVRNSTFTYYGTCAFGSDDGAVLEIGNENIATDNSDYNLIENSIFAYGGHHVLGVHSRYNVIRNNYLHNEAWSAGYGNRTLYLNGWAASSGSNLIENNRFGYSAKPCDANGVAGALVGTSYNIIRNNSFYYNNLSGLGIAPYDSNSSYNLIYGNTFFDNAYNPDPSYGARYYGAITLSDWNATVNENNKIKNNLYYAHAYDNNQPIGYNGASTNQEILNNFDGDVSGNPLFVNASLALPTNKLDASVPNLNLQSGSPAIDKGGALTTITSASGSGASITVGDASYFQDGTLGPTGTVQADWIAVGTASIVAQISSISGNTINLKSSISWTSGAPVYLFKKSDGIQVFYGSAPDAGAYEFVSGTLPPDTTPPSAPTGVSVQ